MRVGTPLATAMALPLAGCFGVQTIGSFGGDAGTDETGLEGSSSGVADSDSESSDSGSSDSGSSGTADDTGTTGTADDTGTTDDTGPGTPTCPVPQWFEYGVESDNFVRGSASPGIDCEVLPGDVRVGSCNDMNFGASEQYTVFNTTTDASYLLLSYSLGTQPRLREVLAAELLVFASGSQATSDYRVDVYELPFLWGEGVGDGRVAVGGESSWSDRRIPDLDWPVPGTGPISAASTLAGVMLPTAPRAVGEVSIPLYPQTVWAWQDAPVESLLLLYSGVDPFGLWVRTTESPNPPRLRVLGCPDL